MSGAPESRFGSKKKIVHASEQQTDRVQLDRWFYERERQGFASDRLLFFDESGVNLSMARRYGRAPSGERVVGYVPKNWGESVTLVGGIGTRGLIAPLILNGSLDGDTFEAYIEQFVLKHIQPGDILVWDNLAAHKRARVRELVANADARIVFLPPYSPDLNPIELAWSKMKTLLRTSEPRTPEKLEAAVADAFSAITQQDIRNWMAHCGY